MFLIIDKSNDRQIINLDHVAKVMFVEARVVVDDETGEEYEAPDTLGIRYAEPTWSIGDSDGGFYGGSEPLIHQFYGDTARAISEAIEDGLYAGAAVYTVTI